MTHGDMHGADSDELDQLAQDIVGEGRRLQAGQTKLGRDIHASPWHGRSADRFRHLWDGEFRRTIAAAAAFLDQASADLRRNAAEQREASTSSGWLSAEFLALVANLHPGWSAVPAVTPTAIEAVALEVGERTVPATGTAGSGGDGNGEDLIQWQASESSAAHTAAAQALVSDRAGSAAGAPPAGPSAAPAETFSHLGEPPARLGPATGHQLATAAGGLASEQWLSAAPRLAGMVDSGPMISLPTPVIGAALGVGLGMGVGVSARGSVKKRKLDSSARQALVQRLDPPVPQERVVAESGAPLIHQGAKLSGSGANLAASGVAELWPA